MMKTKFIQQLLRALMLVLGAGAGAGIAFLCVQVWRLTTDGEGLPLAALILTYGGMSLLGLLAGHLLAPRMIARCAEWQSALEKQLDNLSMAQLAAMFTGLLAGFLLAALLSQILAFMGDSMFTLASSAILYVVLGVAGLSIGRRRTDDFAAMMSHMPTRRDRRGRPQAMLKVLDASSLLDGRVEAVRQAGFLEGEMAVPDFVLADVNRAAESAEPARRQRARRAQALIGRMQKESPALKVLETDEVAPADPDVSLMRLVKERGAALVTCDAALQKAAVVAGVPVLNVNDLACALRSALAAGDPVSVRITREGREPGQGVGYLEDGTMIVVEQAREQMGSVVNAVVVSVLQTSAGRMVFARREA